MIGQKKQIRIKVLRERKGGGSRKRNTPQGRTSVMDKGQTECKWVKKEKGEEGREPVPGKAGSNRRFVAFKNGFS